MSVDAHNASKQNVQAYANTVNKKAQCNPDVSYGDAAEIPAPTDPEKRNSPAKCNVKSIPPQWIKFLRIQQPLHHR